MLMIEQIKFETMAERYGEIVAYAHLEEIEKASGISPRLMTGLDPEVRLLNAINSQDLDGVHTFTCAAA